MDEPIPTLSEFYEEHHAAVRDNGAFVFVPERIEPFDDVQMAFFGGRFIRRHRRLLSWDIALCATRPA